MTDKMLNTIVVLMTVFFITGIFTIQYDRMFYPKHTPLIQSSDD